MVQAKKYINGKFEDSQKLSINNKISHEKQEDLSKVSINNEFASFYFKAIELPKEDQEKSDSNSSEPDDL